MYMYSAGKVEFLYRAPHFRKFYELMHVYVHLDDGV